MILEEFEDGPAVIEPEYSDAVAKEICDTIILPFSGKLFDKISSLDYVRYGGYKSNINGKQPWYIYEKDGQKVAVFKALLGGAALIGSLEELQATGFKNFIIFGTCGVLDGSLETNKIILPTSSVRDEGISYHYAPASDEIGYTPEYLKKFAQILHKHGIAHVQTKAWTTDAFFRETPAKVDRRKAMGCQVVDMEWHRLRLGPNFAKKRSITSFTPRTM